MEDRIRKTVSKLMSDVGEEMTGSEVMDAVKDVVARMRVEEACRWVAHG